MNSKDIKNLIFDMGNVLLKLNKDVMLNKLSVVMQTDVNELRKRDYNTEIYNNFESGLISETEFRKGVCLDLNISIDDNKFDEIWCSMLDDVPLIHINLLQKLKKKFNLYLLSNTNSLHIKYVENRVNELYNISFKSLFDFMFLSFEMKMCKPNEDIYLEILKWNNISIENSVYFDDMPENISKAQTLGINSVIIKDVNNLPEILTNYL